MKTANSMDLSDFSAVIRSTHPATSPLLPEALVWCILSPPPLQMPVCPGLFSFYTFLLSSASASTASNTTGELKTTTCTCVQLYTQRNFPKGSLASVPHQTAVTFKAWPCGSHL